MHSWACAFSLHLLGSGVGLPFPPGPILSFGGVSEKFPSAPRPPHPVRHLVVAVGVVGDGEDGDDVVSAEQAHQGGYRRVVLRPVLGIGARGVQVALLIVALHDAGQHVGTVGLVVEG